MSLFAKTMIPLATLWFVIASISGVHAADQSGVANTTIPVKVERLDPRFDKLVPADAQWTRLATGFTWVEGPVWTRSGDLMFAEITSNSIRELKPDGTVSIWLQPSGYRGTTPYGREPGTNGMTLDPKGRLTVAGHAARNIMRFEDGAHGVVTILADSYQGKKLNSPNDLVYGPDGSLYFTDPPYGLRTQGDRDPEKELKVNGVYRIRNAVKHKPGAPPDQNAVELLVSDLERPNGIAFSPDHKWLYVSNSQPGKWMRYPVNHDGSVGAGTVFLSTGGDRRPGVPDGMKVDVNGNLFASGPGGIWVIAPDGTHLGTLLTAKSTANVAWGGSDGSTLYTTSSDSIFSIHLNTKGLKP